MEGLTCQQVVELVTEFDEGSLPIEVAEAVRGHLEECPDCVRYLAQIREVSHSLRTLPADSLPLAIHEGLVEAFRTWSAEPSGR